MPNNQQVVVEERTISHRDFREFKNWLSQKFPEFGFYGGSQSVNSRAIRRELEQEDFPDPHKQYSIGDIVEVCKMIEYEQNDKVKTKSVKKLLEQWLEEI